MRTPAEIVEAYFARLNAHDLPAVAALFDSDAVLEVPLTRARRGRADILDYFERALEQYPAHHDEPLRVLTDDRTAMVEIRYRSTFKDGRAVEFAAVDVFEIDGGLITRLATYFDSERLARRLARSKEDARDG